MDAGARVCVHACARMCIHVYTYTHSHNIGIGMQVARKRFQDYVLMHIQDKLLRGVALELEGQVER